MEIIQTIVLDLQLCTVFQHIHAKQADSSTRVIQIYLQDMGRAYAIPEGTSAGIRCRKPDGTLVDNPVTVNSDGTLNVRLTRQMLAVPGKVMADIYLIRNGAVLSTFCFIIQVEPVPLGENIPSESELLTLIDAIARTEELNTQIRSGLENGEFIGPAGPVGPVGQDGKSAYFYAQEAGYQGTEEEFAEKLAVGYIDWFGAGISIPADVDLNDYKTNGKYFCSSESRAKTLQNCPTTTNFCMYVFDRTGYKSQLIIALNGKMHIRSSSSSAWRPWAAYTTSAEIAELTQEIRQELIETAIQPDWNQNDTGAADHVRNRPFWTTDETEMIEGFPEELIEVGQEMFVMLPGDFKPVEGGLYLVYVNGISYSCRAYRIADEYGTVVLGNLEMTDLNPDKAFANEGNGEPFAVAHWGGEASCFYARFPTYYNIRILEPKTAAVAQGQQITISSELNAPLPGVGGLQCGKRYRIVLNGMGYDCSAWQLEDPENSYSYTRLPVLLGSLKTSDLDPEGLLADKGDDVPFAIVDCGDGEVILFTSQEGTCSIAVEAYCSKVVHLEEKYLPESVGSVVLRSNTPGSDKRFMLTVDDSGNLSVQQVGISSSDS